MYVNYSFFKVINKVIIKYIKRKNVCCNYSYFFKCFKFLINILLIIVVEFFFNI